jgi:8-oxo-dGTP pyrophosphatase MutT (NUDIX family)
VPADADAFRQAAVLMLFGALDDVPATSAKPLVSAELDVLLIERATTLNHHAGQVAFPGGGVDVADASVVAAALREAQEETGLDPLGVEVLGMLPEVPLAVSNFVVTPVVGWWARQTPVDVVDYGESAQVFRVPVRDLLDPENRYTAVLERGGTIYRGPAFAVQGVVVWGFTAALLNYVFHELGWSVPWDEQREIPAPI